MTTILPLPAAAPTVEPERRSRAKIARFPKAVRDQLNQMIQDGVPYKDIRSQLGDNGQGITEDNISEWKNHGGYNDWVHEQAWRDEIRTQLESFTSLATDPAADPTQLPLAGLEMSLLQICRQLRELGPSTRKEQFENDATKYLRMLNTLSRLSKSLLTLQQYRDTTAAKSARQLKTNGDSAADYALTERERFLDQADDLFGLKSAARLRREMPAQVAQASVAVPQDPAVSQASSLRTDTSATTARPQIPHPAQPAPVAHLKSGISDPQSSPLPSVATPPAPPKPSREGGSSASPSSSDLNLNPGPAADPFHLKSEISDFKSPASPAVQHPANTPQSPLATPPSGDGNSAIQNPKSKIENPSAPPASSIEHPANPDALPIHCYLCGAHPPSFALRPLPHACQICTSCPVPQDPDPHASPPPTSAGSGEVYAVVG